MLLCKVLAHCLLMETVWVSVPSLSTLQRKFICHTLQLVHEQGLKLIIRNSFLLLSFHSLLNLILQLVTTCCHADGFFLWAAPWLKTLVRHIFSQWTNTKSCFLKLEWPKCTSFSQYNMTLSNRAYKLQQLTVGNFIRIQWKMRKTNIFLKSLREIVIVPHQLYSKCASSYHPESLCWHM